MLLGEREQVPGRHRRRRTRRERMTYVGSGIRAGLATLIDHDLPLVVASALLVLGCVFSGCAAVGWLVLDNVRLCWLFAVTGTAAWLFALGIFCIFPPTSSPRHGKNR